MSKGEAGMTREKAIYILKNLAWLATEASTNKTEEAVEMAIKALEQEPCDDAISREAVCEIISDIRDCISVEGYWAILERLKKLPPVSTTKNIVNHGTMNITL